MAQRLLRCGLSLALAYVILAATAATAVPIMPDATNRQYFFYNNRRMALLGVSPSYLCHVSRSSNPDGYCTYENHATFFQRLKDKSLNKTRLWVALNHSPGTVPINSPATTLTPLNYESPFYWDSALQKWDLLSWQEPSPAHPGAGDFFARLQAVLQSAQSRGIIVELTIFAPFDGEFRNGPFYFANNIQQKGLSDEQYLVRYDNGATDSNTGNQFVRERQRALIRKLSDEINGFDNFYWELANEPDYSNMDHTSTINWHRDMIAEIKAAESGRKKHMIAVNFHQNQTINWAASNADVHVINSHYARIDDFTGVPRYGAPEAIRTFLLPGQLTSVDKAFGFNEGRISPPNVTDATPDSVRAEAWEFMLNEGGVFDHLGYQWNSTTDPVPATIRSQLGVLAEFLNGKYNPTTGVLVTPGLNLAQMTKQNGNPPGWCPDLPAYNSAGTTPAGGLPYRTFWGAMQWLRNQYVVYIHHSNTSSGTFEKYDPVVEPNAYKHLNFRVAPGNLSGTFQAFWINPRDGSTLGMHEFAWSGVGTYTLPPSPPYEFDIVLYLKRKP